MSTLNEMQTLRYDLAKEVSFDIKKAKEIMDFVIGNEKAASGINLEKQSNARPDGIYFIMEGGVPVHKSVFSLNSADKVIGVGVKLGNKFASVSTRYAANGEDVSLVDESKDYSGDADYYVEDSWGAMLDWEGEDNTERMEEYLNPQIELKDYEYIPSVAELHLIWMFISEVNNALEVIGAEPIRRDYHWSSTEHSSDNAWYVHFGSGGAWGNRKYFTRVVRPSVACEF